MTGEELVAFAKSKLGVPYVYGMKGKVMTEALYNRLKQTYGTCKQRSGKSKRGYGRNCGKSPCRRYKQTGRKHAYGTYRKKFTGTF